MFDSSAFRSLVACLIRSTASTGRKKIAALPPGIPLVTLLLLLGGTAPGYAQNASEQPKPVLHTSIIRPSRVPSGPSEASGPIPFRTMVRPDLTPVNTGSGIVYTCDPTVAAATCNYLNTTVAGHYNDTFTNANANIYITYGTTGLGQSQGYLNYATYSQYVAALSSIPNKSAIQVSALAALSAYDATPYGSDQVEITAALGTALGISGMTGTTSTLGACTLGTTGCYNEIITITNDPSITLYYDNLGGTEPSDAYDFYAVVEHETDEVLGTSSCVTTQTTPLSDPCGPPVSETGTPSAVDLFRYSSAGNLVLDSSLSTTAGAYFSYNGGSTNGANGVGGTPKVYNTLDNGDDYADYVASSPSCATNQAIQDATGCPGTDAGTNILNDGGSEINILTAVGYQVPATTTACTTSNPNPNPNPESFAAVDDFNGDCKSDIQWRNSSTGQVYTWLMNGSSIMTNQSPGGASSAWVIQGAGDFNGDGMADILWRNTTTGQVYIWFMNGTTITSEQSPGSPTTDWVIQGIGDFNGDGKADILWRNSTTGQVYIWFMNGSTVTSSQTPGTPAAVWVIQGVGDFDGDGMADILWENSTTGQVYIWLMNGNTITSNQSPGSLTSNSSIQGIGDFDGNGKSDILWRNNTTGQVNIWFMNGTAITSSQSPGSPTTDWVIQGVGDYDASGRAGILWRNSSTGQVYIWLMNGATVTSNQSPGTPAAVWQIATLSP
jgi:hypothetical protein